MRIVCTFRHSFKGPAEPCPVRGSCSGESYSLSVPEDQGRLDEAEKLYKAMEFVQCIAACSPAFATDPIPTEELSQTTALIPLDSKSPDLSHRAPDFPNMPRALPSKALLHPLSQAAADGRARTFGTQHA